MSETRGCFNVVIEEYLADTWQESIESLLGEPTVKRNSAGTIHINNEQKNKKGSKLMLKGSPQSFICGYVFEELPKMVLGNKTLKLRDSKKPQKNISKVDESTPEEIQLNMINANLNQGILQKLP